MLSSEDLKNFGESIAAISAAMAGFKQTFQKSGGEPNKSKAQSKEELTQRIEQLETANVAMFEVFQQQLEIDKDIVTKLGEVTTVINDMDNAAGSLIPALDVIQARLGKTTL
jgi:hypothetical protein